MFLLFENDAHFQNLQQLIAHFKQLHGTGKLSGNGLHKQLLQLMYQLQFAHIISGFISINSTNNTCNQR